MEQKENFKKTNKSDDNKGIKIELNQGKQDESNSFGSTMFERKPNNEPKEKEKPINKIEEENPPKKKRVKKYQTYTIELKRKIIDEVRQYKLIKSCLII